MVFVHGVLSSPRCWKKLIGYLEAESVLDFSDVATIYYRTRLFGQGDDLEGIGRQVKGWLEQRLTQYEHVFIVAHSLGGLVIQSVLQSLHHDTSSEARRLFKKIRLVLLFAVPHLGSRLASMLRFVPLITSNPLRQQLALGNPTASRLCSDVEKILEEAQRAGEPLPAFKVAFGTKDAAVAETSAIHPNMKTYALVVRAGHGSLIRPRHPDAEVVRFVVNQLSPYSTLNPLLDYLRIAKGVYENLTESPLYVPVSGRRLASNGALGPTVEDLPAEVRELVLGKSTKGVLITGPYGSGKTVTAYMIGYDLAVRSIEHFPHNLIPLFIRLDATKGPSTLREAIPAYLQRFGASFTDEWLRKLIRPASKEAEVTLCLILDGFDELAGWVDWDRARSYLDEIREFQEVGFKVVVTCRSTFFRSEREVAVVPVDSRFRIEALSSEVRKRYLESAITGAPQETVDASMRLLDGKLSELCAVPIHLRLFAEYVKNTQEPLDLSKWAEVPAAALYDAYITANAARHFSLHASMSLEERYRLLEDMAYQWFLKEQRECSFEELQRVAAELFSGETTVEQRLQQAQELANCCGLIRIGDLFRFSHKSIQEFLIGSGLTRDLFSGRFERWGQPLYTDVFEFIFQLGQARGFDRVDLQRLAGAAHLAIGNFLAMAYRHGVTEAEPLMRAQLGTSLAAVNRCVAAQGLGMYPPTAQNIESLMGAVRADSNAIIRSVAQRVLETWVNIGQCGPLQESVQSVVATHILLSKKDADDVLMIHTGRRVLNTYRRALLQGDRMWPSTVGAIYNICVFGDTESLALVEEVGSESRHPAIRSAYRHVQPFVEAMREERKRGLAVGTVGNMGRDASLPTG